MIVLSFTLIAVLLVVLQTTVFMVHPLWLFAPDLYYVLVAYMAYRFDLLRSLIVLFFLGCVLDVFSGTILGMYSVFCFTAYFLLRFSAQKMPVSESLYQLPFIGVSYLLVSWITYVVLNLFVPDALVVWSWWKMLIRTGLIIIFAYPLFHLFEFLQYKLQNGLFTWKKLKVRSDNRYRDHS